MTIASTLATPTSCGSAGRTGELALALLVLARAHDTRSRDCCQDRVSDLDADAPRRELRHDWRARCFEDATASARADIVQRGPLAEG